MSNPFREVESGDDPMLETTFNEVENPALARCYEVMRKYGKNPDACNMQTDREDIEREIQRLQSVVDEFAQIGPLYRDEEQAIADINKIVDAA